VFVPQKRFDFKNSTGQSCSKKTVQSNKIFVKNEVTCCAPNSATMLKNQHGLIFDSSQPFFYSRLRNHLIIKTFTL
jgi:hypothetical protein